MRLISGSVLHVYFYANVFVCAYANAYENHTYRVNAEHHAADANTTLRQACAYNKKSVGLFG